MRIKIPKENFVRRSIPMRSDVIKKGAPAAPNRSLLYALGYTKEELERPLIGVVCSYNEIVPGHMNLDKIAEAVKMCIRDRAEVGLSISRIPGPPLGPS